MLRPSIFGSSFDLMDSFFDDPFYGKSAGLRTMSAMSTDVSESDDAYLIEMDLPGFAKENIKAELKKGTLTILASRSEEHEEKDKKAKRYVTRERYSGHYKRSFYVGEAVTEEDIKAKFKDGVLSIIVPKKEKQKEVEQKKFISIEG
jgi:HSP20 family molecular chaperone IbpA